MQHFVPTARVELVRDGRQARAPIAVDERTHYFQSLSDRIVASRENVDRKVATYVPQFPRIGEPWERL
jgi:hypothetical protein